MCIINIFLYETKMIVNNKFWQLCSPECNCHCCLILPQFQEVNLACITEQSVKIA